MFIFVVSKDKVEYTVNIDYIVTVHIGINGGTWMTLSTGTVIDCNESYDMIRHKIYAAAASRMTQ